MKELFNQFRGTIITLVIGITITGLAAAADARWLTQVSFKEWVMTEQRQEIREEIRELRREIQSLESELLWTDDERKRAGLQQQIQFLQLEIQSLELELEEFQ